MAVAPARQSASNGSRAAAAAAALHEIDDWRRSHLNAADSAHHIVVLQIAASFDSARGSPLGQGELLRTLTRLDRLNDANESAWFVITTEINRMADSATADHGGEVRTGIPGACCGISSWRAAAARPTRHRRSGSATNADLGQMVEEIRGICVHAECSRLRQFRHPVPTAQERDAERFGAASSK